ncbi:MAG: hypothetical protein J0H89_01460 [Rhizobiales bacterium]|nr:hypothetical protein [Hyphomicrobiales bacterium]
MIRFAVAAGALGLSLAACSIAVAAPDARAMPMHFDLWTEGSAQTCGETCRTWVSAVGAITADTPRDFDAFAKSHNLAGVTIALDSDGGSVLGALSLGRSIRRLGMITTVGKTIPLSPGEGDVKRARLQPRAYCESMCAFVLLAGVERRVPAQARVMVHQIWLGDRRDDPTAASYSAEDLVVVQRDIGRLAQYTVEMGGGIDLLEIALKIPPWEPMRMLTREELRSMKVMTAVGDVTEPGSGPATNSAALASGKRAAANGSGWIMEAADTGPVLSRSHPLTVEGQDIGSFELTFTCGPARRDYTVSYVERRRGDRDGAPAPLAEVKLKLGGKTVPLKIASSRVKPATQGLESVASASMTADLLQTFAAHGSRSLVVETASADDSTTAIRVGNAGMASGLSGLEARCATGSPIRNTARTNIRQGG